MNKWHISYQHNPGIIDRLFSDRTFSCSDVTDKQKKEEAPIFDSLPCAILSPDERSNGSEGHRVSWRYPTLSVVFIGFSVDQIKIRSSSIINIQLNNIRQTDLSYLLLYSTLKTSAWLSNIMNSLPPGSWNPTSWARQWERGTRGLLGKTQTLLWVYYLRGLLRSSSIKISSRPSSPKKPAISTKVIVFDIAIIVDFDIEFFQFLRMLQTEWLALLAILPH